MSPEPELPPRHSTPSGEGRDAASVGDDFALLESVITAGRLMNARSIDHTEAALVLEHSPAAVAVHRVQLPRPLHAEERNAVLRAGLDVAFSINPGGLLEAVAGGDPDARGQVITQLTAEFAGGDPGFRAYLVGLFAECLQADVDESNSARVPESPTGERKRSSRSPFPSAGGPACQPDPIRGWNPDSGRLGSYFCALLQGHYQPLVLAVLCERFVPGLASAQPPPRPPTRSPFGARDTASAGRRNSRSLLPASRTTPVPGYGRWERILDGAVVRAGPRRRDCELVRAALDHAGLPTDALDDAASPEALTRALREAVLAVLASDPHVEDRLTVLTVAADWNPATTALDRHLPEFRAHLERHGRITPEPADGRVLAEDLLECLTEVHPFALPRPLASVADRIASAERTRSFFNQWFESPLGDHSLQRRRPDIAVLADLCGSDSPSAPERTGRDRMLRSWARLALQRALSTHGRLVSPPPRELCEDLPAALAVWDPARESFVQALGRVLRALRHRGLLTWPTAAIPAPAVKSRDQRESNR